MRQTSISRTRTASRTGSSERCEVGKGLKDPSSKLFASWKDYAEKAGLFVGNNKRFKAEMNRLGYRDKKLSFGDGVRGLLRAAGRPCSPAERAGGGDDPDHLDAVLTGAGEEGQFPCSTRW